MVNTCIYSIYIYIYLCVYAYVHTFPFMYMSMFMYMYLHMSMDMLDMDVLTSMYKHLLYNADAFLFIQHILSLVKLQWDLVAWPQISFLWSSIFSFSRLVKLSLCLTTFTSCVYMYVHIWCISVSIPIYLKTYGIPRIWMTSLRKHLFVTGHLKDNHQF